MSIFNIDAFQEQFILLFWLKLVILKSECNHF